MIQNVSDSRSNPKDQIEHAVEVIGKSKHRQLVFEAIYFGSRKFKSVERIAKMTRLANKRVLEEAKKLSRNGIVHQRKLNGETVYDKDTFYAGQKSRILSLVRNPAKLDKLATKTRPLLRIPHIGIIKLAPKSISISEITVDDIDSFSKVRKLKNAVPAMTPIAENKFKKGVMKIIGENGKFKDWGGEKNDLCSTRLKLQGKRIATAFAFKGKGLQKKKLTPNFMGKNGDQIQRLFQSPAKVFILQYWSQVDSSVVAQMEMAAKVKSYHDGTKIYYGIIDGGDTHRLVTAYPKAFK